MRDALADVLIVEDEEAIAENIRSILEMGRYGSRVAHGSAEALARIAERRPDLVLLDINLGEEHDGIELAHELAGRRQLPVMFLTAYSDDEFLDRARAAAPVGFVVKPFEARQLLSMVKVALGCGAREEAMRSEAGRLATALRAAGDAALFSSEGGALVDWNPAAAEWFGLEPPGEGKRFLEDVCELKAEDGADRMATLFAEVFAQSGELVAGRGRVRAAGGMREVLYTACGRTNARGARELVLSLRALASGAAAAPATAAAPAPDAGPGQVERARSLEKIEELRLAGGSEARAALLVLTHFFLLRQRYGAEAADTLVESYAGWLRKVAGDSATVLRWPEAGFLVLGGPKTEGRWLQNLAARLDRTPLRLELSSATRSGIVLVSASAKVVDCGRPATLEELAFQLDAIVNAEAQRVEAA